MSQNWSHLPSWFLLSFLRMGRQTGCCSQQPVSCRQPCAASSIFPPLAALASANAVASTTHTPSWQQVGLSGTNKAQLDYTGESISNKGTPVKHWEAEQLGPCRSHIENRFQNTLLASAQESETSSALFFVVGFSELITLTMHSACAGRPSRTQQRQITSCVVILSVQRCAFPQNALQ